MSPWFYNVYMEAVIKKSESEDGEDGSKVSGGGKSVEIA